MTRPSCSRQLAASQLRREFYGGARLYQHPILQVLRRQVRKDGLIYFVLAECRLVPFKAKAPQPSTDIHPRP